ncbi:radical SAM/SPASM domain-containing protein [Acanthopleuribacter pedis]|uniref:Radical SAM protein n=1 Tax=Acanthopleuribacter pedis TaxID=442870 RepID=A0A8J7U6S6_9BACT|nr:radical SAM/SPASM domain-containing protein [Acanthopleuribacter pedis]MBO1323087.1 radical SAM protein [Acanthopleuribacter pedis]
MLARFTYRMATELAPNVAFKAAYLYGFKGMKAIHSYKRRLKNDELYPPFMFVALTNTCNLRCQGCWVEKVGKARHMTPEDIDAVIENGKKQNAYYYTLLGGEPFLHKNLMSIFERHNDCYFQVITNGMFFSEETVQKLRDLGNVTPLISIDGMQDQNDMRRGEGTFKTIMDGLDRLKKHKLFFGIATTATGKNMEEVMSDEYVNMFIEKGAMYLWYYIYRPVGEEPHPEYCMQKQQIVDMRRRLLKLRRKHPILLIDTYWTAEGEAFCPAATGLGFHIGPEGSIEPCPPLSFATNKVQDNRDDLFSTINESEYLRGFQQFVKNRTKGCVILEHPQELASFIRDHGAVDYSTRDALSEIDSISPRHSHHLPDEEIPEDYWVYRFLKKQVFFGMGALG